MVKLNDGAIKQMKKLNEKDIVLSVIKFTS